MAIYLGKTLVANGCMLPTSSDAEASAYLSAGTKLGTFTISNDSIDIYTQKFTVEPYMSTGMKVATIVDDTGTEKDIYAPSSQYFMIPNWSKKSDILSEALTSWWTPKYDGFVLMYDRFVKSKYLPTSSSYSLSVFIGANTDVKDCVYNCRATYISAEISTDVVSSFYDVSTPQLFIPVYKADSTYKCSISAAGTKGEDTKMWYVPAEKATI